MELVYGSDRSQARLELGSKFELELAAPGSLRALLVDNPNRCRPEVKMRVGVGPNVPVILEPNPTII
jgi:hypothetical protein